MRLITFIRNRIVEVIPNFINVSYILFSFFNVRKYTEFECSLKWSSIYLLFELKKKKLN